MRRTTKAAWRLFTGFMLAAVLILTGCGDKDYTKEPGWTTPADYLLERQTKNGTVVFTVLGSSVTSGMGVSLMKNHWTAMLVEDLMKTKKLDKLDYHNNGQPGITTSKVLSEKRVEEVIATKPDLVLFETCLLNDYYYEVPVETTISNLDAIMDKFQKESPNTRVILQSPNPRNPSDKNALGLSYQDYLKQTKKHIQDKGWEYIDVYSDFEKQRKADNRELKDVLPDGIHPNETGYQYWLNTVKAYFYNGS